MSLPKELKCFLEKFSAENDKKFNELKGEIGSLKDYVKRDNDSKFGKLREEISTLQESNKKLVEKLEEIEDDVFRLQKLHDKVDALNGLCAEGDLNKIETFLFTNCIKITNVPANTEVNEQEIFKKILEIMEYDLKDSEVRKIFRYRTNSYYGAFDKPDIIVEFVNTDVSCKFLQSYKEFSSTKTINSQSLGLFQSSFVININKCTTV